MNELSELFKLVAEDKKKKKEEFDSIVGNLKLDSMFEEVANLKKETKKKKVQEQKTAKAFENWLYSEIPKHQEQISENPIEDSLEEVLEEQKETLIEKSLGLLAEPSDVKQQNDPLTPLDQNFATLDDLQKHYSTFLSRIQQQLSTLGGGGETNLAYMDMPLKYVTTSSYIVTPQDYYIGVNYPGAVTITLPTPRKNGKTYIIKDELGEASKGVNRYITIIPSGSDTIDSRDRAFIAYDYGSLTFVYRNGWRVV